MKKLNYTIKYSPNKVVTLGGGSRSNHWERPEADFWVAATIPFFHLRDGY